ncbi:MAG: cytidylate kinase family protein, partial [Armatimonadota bacterium]
VKFRAERLAERMGVSVRTARRAARDLDRRRNQFERTMYRIDPADPHNYDLVIDSESLTIAIAAELNRLNFRPDLVGGDFNTPPDVDVLEPITIGMKDTFAKVGVGYGATCVNPYPCLVRIDQIHCLKTVTPTRSRVVATQNSDHRMLISDFTRNP